MQAEQPPTLPIALKAPLPVDEKGARADFLKEYKHGVYIDNYLVQQGYHCERIAWQISSLELGLRVFQEARQRRHNAVLRKSVTAISLPSIDVFKTIMDLRDNVRLEWDLAFGESDTLAQIDKQADVIHFKFRAKEGSLKALDACLLRTWRLEADGVYVIVMRSWIDSACPPPTAGFTRIHNLSLVWTVNAFGNAETSRVSHSVYIDSGLDSHLPVQALVSFSNSLVQRVAGLRDYLHEFKILSAQGKQLSLYLSEEGEGDEDGDEDDDIYLDSEWTVDSLASENPESQRESDHENLLAHVEESLSKSVSLPGSVSRCLSSVREGILAEIMKKTWSTSVPPEEETEDSKHCWGIFDGNILQVRSKSYLEDRSKEPAGPPLLEYLGFDWLASSTRLDNVCSHSCSRVQELCMEFEKQCGPKPYPLIFSIVLQLPGRRFYQMANYWFIDKEPEKGSLLEKFINGDDDFRSDRLKMIPRISQGGWVVKRAVGEKPIIIGRKLKIRYYQTSRYLEVDIDIGSSPTANNITQFVLGSTKSLAIDLAFTIEGRSAEELPERIVGLARVLHLDHHKAIKVDQKA